MDQSQIILKMIKLQMLQQVCHVVDVDNDGDPDIIPQNGWYFNSNEDKNPDLNIFYLLMKKRFIPKQRFFQKITKIHQIFLQTRDKRDLKFPVDLDNDGCF